MPQKERRLSFSDELPQLVTVDSSPEAVYARMPSAVAIPGFDMAPAFLSGQNADGRRRKSIPDYSYHILGFLVVGFVLCTCTQFSTEAVGRYPTMLPSVLLNSLL